MKFPCPRVYFQVLLLLVSGRVFVEHVGGKGSKKIEHAVGGFFCSKPKMSKTSLYRKITLLRVIPTMTCRVVVVRWGLSG